MLNESINKVKDVIYLEDIQDEMIKIYHEGREKAHTTYIDRIDEHFKWLRGEVSVFAGIGNHGKSTLVNQLILLQAIKNDSKVAIFSPEQNPPDYFYNDLIHTYLKKPVESHLTNKAPFEEYMEGLEFIKKHFFYIYPLIEIPTQKYINDRFRLLMDKEGCTFLVIDPFNQLTRDWELSNRDDRYIAGYLQEEKRFALKYDIHKITITHPNSTIGMGDDGNPRCPTVFHLAGGAMWNNIADNICFIHRPRKKTDPNDNTTLFISEKIKKQKIVGIPGEVELTFDRFSNRFMIKNENGTTDEIPF